MHFRTPQPAAAWPRLQTLNEVRDDSRRLFSALTSVETRMAALCVERGRDGLETDHHDLAAAGFAEADIIAYAANAASAADRRLPAGLFAHRQARISLGANAIIGMALADTGAVNTALHHAGLATSEIGSLYGDIIGTALRIVRESRPDYMGAAR